MINAAIGLAQDHRPNIPSHNQFSHADSNMEMVDEPFKQEQPAVRPTAGIEDVGPIKKKQPTEQPATPPRMQSPVFVPTKKPEGSEPVMSARAGSEPVVSVRATTVTKQVHTTVLVSSRGGKTEHSQRPQITEDESSAMSVSLSAVVLCIPVILGLLS
ncbi:hypothetical protein BX070DRAFT_250758 [Coemansia spiralis]|nr:hypothetical protein BX070DRAFT_250758 [Coemansia spiralis]